MLYLPYIESVIQTGSAEGMIGMDESILRLYQEGKITNEAALRFAMSPEQLQKNWCGKKKRRGRFFFQKG